MAVTKPSWLRRALALLNWDIFTWKVYVGDWIEYGIDWTLVYVNNALDWAKVAYDWGVAAWDRAVELARDLTAIIYRETGYLWNKISTWWSDLGDWWAAKVTWVRDLLAAASNTLRDLIDSVKRGVASLSAAWDNFKGMIPSIDEILSWFRAWRDKVIATMVGWGVLAGTEIRDLLASKVKDLEPFWKGWQEIKDKVFELFSDPEKWLLDMIERMLARFL